MQTGSTAVEAVTFGQYADRWLEQQNLAASTMRNYKRAIDNHLRPEFDHEPLPRIDGPGITRWEKREEARHTRASVRTWRAVLHVILADAHYEGLIPLNPAMRRRGRGKRAGRSHWRGPEKIVTDALGSVLLAERAALLSGRDDEFVALVLMRYTGIRWGELVGLETRFVRPGKVRIEWQLYEHDNGTFDRCPPKNDSYRTIDTPDWLTTLLVDHIARTKPKPCPCHGKTYLFHGRGNLPDLDRAAVPVPRITDVARLAAVAPATVSNVFNHPELVAPVTFAHVTAAIEQLGFVRGASRAVSAPHFRRTDFARWIFRPATSGRYAPNDPHQSRPVPILARPWPGIPVRGRGAPARATACWLPIAEGLTPQGLRHSHRTDLEELGVEKVLCDDRMGHTDGSMSARYTHVTPAMRTKLRARLTQHWSAAIHDRAAICPRSPVPTLNTILHARQRNEEPPHSATHTSFRLAKQLGSS